MHFLMAQLHLMLCRSHTEQVMLQEMFLDSGNRNRCGPTNITSLGTLTTLTVDNVIINGTTIGHTSDTDAISIGSDGGDYTNTRFRITSTMEQYYHLVQDELAYTCTRYRITINRQWRQHQRYKLTDQTNRVIRWHELNFHIRWYSIQDADSGRKCW